MTRREIIGCGFGLLFAGLKKPNDAPPTQTLTFDDGRGNIWRLKADCFERAQKMGQITMMSTHPFGGAANISWTDETRKS
jgi:hypothetical protein